MASNEKHLTLRPVSSSTPRRRDRLGLFCWASPRRRRSTGSSTARLAVGGVPPTARRKCPDLNSTPGVPGGWLRVLQIHKTSCACMHTCTGHQHPAEKRAKDEGGKLFSWRALKQSSQNTHHNELCSKIQHTLLNTVQCGSSGEVFLLLFRSDSRTESTSLRFYEMTTTLKSR